MAELSELGKANKAEWALPSVYGSPRNEHFRQSHGPDLSRVRAMEEVKRGTAESTPEKMNAEKVKLISDDGKEPTGTQGLVGGVPLELLEEAQLWNRYALAIYGWQLYFWTNRYSTHRCCKVLVCSC